MKVYDYNAKLDYGSTLNKGKRTEQAGREQADHAQTSVDAEPQGDRVSLSDEGRLRTEAYKEAMNAPEVREDKVAEIKAQIVSGEYKIDSEKIAEGLLRDELDLFI
ncbi:flagellar biosynthesis anti-sigma factor FlgM [Halodesulfovibrio aestuarii]|uniref:Negative regulator of flagellin synthesis n=1 Tax=Halodesulfovibrio aestuarii TaxID=126333 RepID=A0ABV4JVM9_9BACT